VIDRRRRAYPEFVELLEDRFDMHRLWETGSLACLRSALHGGAEATPRSMWEACEQLRGLLTGLPERVMAPDVESFIVGSSPSDVTLLHDRVQESLRRWHGWLTELYTLALSVTTQAQWSTARPAAVHRLHDLVYAELDPFLSPRLRHWAERSRLGVQDAPAAE
jgi:hypothetical protein